jgi:hypothetical protein
MTNVGHDRRVNFNSDILKSRARPEQTTIAKRYPINDSFPHTYRSSQFRGVSNLQVTVLTCNRTTTLSSRGDQAKRAPTK